MSLHERQFIEIDYAELDAQPMACPEKIYAGLGIGGFEDIAPRFDVYLESIRGYKKTPHRFTAETLDKVDAGWGKWLRRWNYQRPGLQKTYRIRQIVKMLYFSRRRRAAEKVKGRILNARTSC